MKKWNMASLAPIIFILVNFQLSTLSAQPTQEWVRRWDSQYHSGDRPSKLTLDRFGNIIVTGSIGTTSQGNDIATVKYNSGGTQQWAVTYNQISNTNDLATSIAADSSGNVFVGGYSGFNLGPHDAVTIKYSPGGVQQWAKIYAGTAGSTDDQVGGVAVDRAGYIYVAGGTGEAYSTGNAFLIKYNTNGDSVWVRRYSVGGITTGYRSIAIDRFNNIYATGYTFNLNRQHGITIKYDSSGVLQWAMQYISNYNNNDALVKISLDTSGNAYVTGETNAPGSEIYLTIKYSSSGGQQWVRNYSGPTGFNEAYSIVAEKIGNVYVTGKSANSGGGTDFTTIKYNTNGDSLWVRRYAADNLAATSVIAIDDSANIYITGSTFSSGMTTLKYSTTGIFRWVASYSGQSVDIAVDGLRNIYVTGSNADSGTGADYITIKYSQPLGIFPISEEVPKEFKLGQNYPNPFNQFTIINYQLSISSNVTIRVYDVLGNEVAVLVNDKQRAGIYQVDFDAANLSSGVYFYQLITENFTQTNKLILLK